MVSSIWAKQETELNMKTVLYLVDHCAKKMSSNVSSPVSYLVKTVNLYLIQSKLKSEDLQEFAL